MLQGQHLGPSSHQFFCVSYLKSQITQLRKIGCMYLRKSFLQQMTKLCVCTNGYHLVSADALKYSRDCQDVWYFIMSLLYSQDCKN